MTSIPDLKPRRGVEGTKAAILTAAKRRFAQNGFEGATLRAIARDANVNEALIIRYFGSKIGLFAQAVADGFQLGELLGGDRADIGVRFADYLFEKRNTNESHDSLFALLQSAGHPEAGPLLQAALEEQIIGPLAAWLGGENAPVRASLFVALVLGAATIRDVLQSPSLSLANKKSFLDVSPRLSRA